MQPLTGDDPAEVAGYRLRARLGVGGMGRVYLAFTPGGQPVALKLVRPGLADDEVFRERFRHEAEAARRVRGLCTAQVLDADPAGRPPWLATAYVAGPSLYEAVAGHGAMPERTVLVLMAGVAEALQAIHGAGVIHGDLKPSNVLLGPGGPRVVDFGIAGAVAAATLTRTGARVGAPQFMAPEQVAGGPVTPALDVFALGSLAAYAAVGRPPFGADGLDVVFYRIRHEPPDLAGCPPAVRDVIERCLAKDPAARLAPSEIVGLCRARIAASTGQIAQPWLPPSVVAGLASYAPPPAWPNQPVPVPQPIPLAQSVPWTQPGQPTQYAPPAQTLPAQAPGWPGPALPVPRRPARISRTLAISAVVAVVLLAAGIGGALYALRDPGRALAGPTHRPGQNHHPAVAPTTSATNDPCLAGTWTQVLEELPDQIGRNRLQLVGGQGVVNVFRANGTGSVNYGAGTTFSARPDVVMFTQITKGTATFHWRTSNGILTISDVSAHGSIAFYAGKLLVTRDPLTLNMTPKQYLCTPSTLRIFPATGGSTDLDRDSGQATAP